MAQNKNRTEDILKGIKVGAVNGGVEKAVQPVADIFYKTALEALGSDHPLVETIAASGSKALSYLLFAEALDLGGVLLDSKVPNAGSKGELLAQLARKKAGEEMGEEAVKTLITYLPNIFEMFSEFNTEDLEAALEQNDLDSSPEKLEARDDEKTEGEFQELESLAQEMLK